MTELLTAEDVLGAADVIFHEFAVPEWGGKIVRIRSLSGADAVRLADSGGKKDGAIRIAVLSIVDANGAPIFSEADIPSLLKKPMAGFLRVQREAFRLNGIEEPGATKND